MPPMATYAPFGRPIAILPAKFVVGLLLLGFALLDAAPASASPAFGPRLLPVGGLLSGFFGGLSGMQGALRAAFLVRAGLSKEAFIATGVAIACLVDLARLVIYLPGLARRSAAAAYPGFGDPVLVAAVLAAFAGAMAGNFYLRKVTIRALQRFVAAMLVLVALGLMSGLL
jgi:hypothetical protein